MSRRSDRTSVCVATSDGGREDPLTVLEGLSRRHGFQRCSGRLFATEHLVRGINNFYKNIKQRIPDNVVVRTHVHPQEFTKEILDYVDADSDCSQRNIICSPTNFAHVLVAVRMTTNLARSSAPERTELSTSAAARKRARRNTESFR